MHSNKNDGDACATLCRFPLLDVGVGEVTRIESATELAQQVNERTTSFSNVNIEVAQSGPEGVLVAVTADEASGNGEQAILVVGKVEGVWTIGGIRECKNEGLVRRNILKITKEFIPRCARFPQSGYLV